MQPAVSVTPSEETISATGSTESLEQGMLQIWSFRRLGSARWHGTRSELTVQAGKRRSQYFQFPQSGLK